MSTEAQARISVVGSQRDIEAEVLAAWREGATAAAIFLVPTPLTPFYIDPSHVRYDETDNLYKLVAGADLPKGLMPKAKAEDPQQLSTVLGRALTASALVIEGVPVTVFVVKTERPQVENESENVIPDAGSVMGKFRKWINIVPISAQDYNEIKDLLPAACYQCGNGEQGQAVVFATQVNDPRGGGAKFDKLTGVDATPYITAVNVFALDKNEPSLVGMRLSSRASLGQMVRVPANGIDKNFGD